RRGRRGPPPSMGLPRSGSAVAGITAWQAAADRAVIVARTADRPMRRGNRPRRRLRLRARPRGGRAQETAGEKARAGCRRQDNGWKPACEILDVLGHHAERAVAQPLGELRDFFGRVFGVAPDRRRTVLIERVRRPAQHLAERGDFACRTIALLFEERGSALAHRADQLFAHLFRVLNGAAAVALAARHAVIRTKR